MRGDSFLTNLTIRTPIEPEASLADIYLSSEATYRVLLPGRFVSFSPECFVKLQGDGTRYAPDEGYHRTPASPMQQRSSERTTKRAVSTIRSST